MRFVYALIASFVSLALAAGQEPVKRATGLVVPKDVKARHAASWAKHGHHLKAMVGIQATSFDCRKVVLADGTTVNWVPDFDDQGQCGDCWVFSGADPCAAAFMKAGYPKFTFSKQQLIDCQFPQACGGGWPEDVAKIAKTVGLVTDADYGKTYNASPGNCKSVDPSKFMKIADYGFVGQSDGVPSYEVFKACMVKYGVISICYDANGTPSSGEGGGVWKGTGGGSIDHAIKAIAFDDTKSTKGAVLCWNQWHAGGKDLFWAEWGANGIGTSAMWVSATAIPPPPVPPGPVPPGPVPPGPIPPTPSGGAITIATAGYSAIIDPATKTITLPPGWTVAGGVKEQLRAELQAAGFSLNIIADMLQLFADIKSKAAMSVIIADLLKIMGDLTTEPMPKEMPRDKPTGSIRDGIAELVTILTVNVVPAAPPKEPLPASLPSYNDAYRKALAEGKRLLVFVRCEPTHFPAGCIVTREDNFPVDGIACILSIPNGSKMAWTLTIDSPTVASVERAVNPPAAKAVSPTTRPFPAWPLPSASADDDLEAAGPWPESLEFPVGMKRYKRAAMTQEIAVTNDRDRITPVHRLEVENKKWLVSGGMLGIEGWRSDLYKNDAKPNEWIGDIQVLNSLGYMQPNRGWKREYPDGAKFLDVLSSKGKVFEVRQREKTEGKWHSSVIFDDEKARPLGYTGLTSSCISCHNAKDGAGTGGYAAGLVPGGDTILSDPFAKLE